MIDGLVRTGISRSGGHVYKSAYGTYIHTYLGRYIHSNENFLSVNARASTVRFIACVPSVARLYRIPDDTFCILEKRCAQLKTSNTYKNILPKYPPLMDN